MKQVSTCKAGADLGVALAPCPGSTFTKRFGKPVGFPASNDVQMEVFHIELLVYRRLIGSCYIVVDWLGTITLSEFDMEAYHGHIQYTKITSGTAVVRFHIKCTLWLFNIAMENHPFRSGPSKNHGYVKVPEGSGSRLHPDESNREESLTDLGVPFCRSGPTVGPQKTWANHEKTLTQISQWLDCYTSWWFGTGFSIYWE